MALDGAAPFDAGDDGFALSSSFSALLGWLSQERGEERSDPESLASAICVGKNEQTRIVVVATSLLWA